ncbi:hypothetical protein [Nocardia fusca]|uniref:Uncharacterized protein n=1 Tax=Nocardia fusca TaxID=941183 RepID=A0ABV3F1N8_9NOCA
MVGPARAVSTITKDRGQLPLAVEHLGEAVLWKKNPVLVVPLAPEAETSLVELATVPSLTDPKHRTIGLELLLSRIDTAIGALPLNPAGTDELRAARMPDLPITVSASDLGSDFNPAEAQRLYGGSF